MSFSTDLLRRVRPYAHFPCDLRDHATLIDGLAFMLQLMLASEQLVDLAAMRAGQMGCTQLRDYLLAHAEEERGHAAWLVRDLDSSGAAWRDKPLSPHAIEAAGSQYYLIMHAHPAALLGYMAVLECQPMPLEHVSELEQLHGVELLRTLRFHAVHDIDHGRDVQRALDDLPADLHELVTNNALNTARHIAAAARDFGRG